MVQLRVAQPSTSCLTGTDVTEPCSPCAWPVFASYVFGQHTAKEVSTWSLRTLEQVLNGTMQSQVPAHGDPFQDVTSQTLGFACQEWYSRYYAHPE